MEFIEPSAKLIAMSFPVGGDMHPIYNKDIDGFSSIIERAAKTCYKSKLSSTEDNKNKFVDKIINVNHHESVSEHASATFSLITSRDVMAEITRHRLASFSIESQRYVNYEKSGLKVIPPQRIDRNILKSMVEDNPFEPGNNFDVYTWYNHIQAVELNYIDLLEQGWKPEEARSILPNCVATEIVMTANVREWRHILQLRTSKSAYIEMRVLAEQIKNILAKISPTCFELPQNM